MNSDSVVFLSRLAQGRLHNQIQTANTGYFLKQRRLGRRRGILATAMDAARGGRSVIGRRERESRVTEVPDLAVIRLGIGDVVVNGSVELPETDDPRKMTS